MNKKIKNVSNKPTLYKSGAEKILLGLGVPYDIENEIADLRASDMPNKNMIYIFVIFIWNLF